MGSWGHAKSQGSYKSCAGSRPGRADRPSHGLLQASKLDCILGTIAGLTPRAKRAKLPSDGCLGSPFCQTLITHYAKTRKAHARMLREHRGESCAARARLSESFKPHHQAVPHLPNACVPDRSDCSGTSSRSISWGKNWEKAWLSNDGNLCLYL